MRKESWPEDLFDVVHRFQNVPFEYGPADCVSFVRECVIAMTNEDPIPGLKWADEDQAKALLDDQGIALRLNAIYEQTPLSLAGRGDIISLDTPEGDCIGICTGHEAMFMTRDGLRPVRLDACKAAWRVR